MGYWELVAEREARGEPRPSYSLSEIRRELSLARSAHSEK